MSWTDERSAMLARLWDAGLTISQIAADFGVTRGVISGKVHRLGLVKRQTFQPRYRSGPASYEEKVRRAAERKLTVVKTAKPKKDNSPKRFLNVELSALTKEICRFPHGEGPFLFCGQPSISHSSYCAHHHSVCYGRVAATPEQIARAAKMRAALKFGRAA